MELATRAGGPSGIGLLAWPPPVHRPHWSAGDPSAVVRVLQLHDRVAMLPLLQLEYRHRVLDREPRGVQAVFA